MRGAAGLPHARGGVSTFVFFACECYGVFPTHVGVFLVLEEIPVSPLGLPHARGGVSSLMLNSSNASKVFPTHVGVFPSMSKLDKNAVRLPHARGGVSKFGSYHVRQQGSSPRTWGCF